MTPPRRPLPPLSAVLTCVLLTAASCDGAPVDTGPDAPPPRGAAPEVSSGAPTLRRLTQDQYRNSIEDLLGEGLVLPTRLEPDTAIDGLMALGSSATTISSVGVEQYEDAAFNLAEQVAADEARLADVVGCSPEEDGCLDAFVARFGRSAWRRTLTQDEVDSLVALGEAASGTLADPAAGVTYALAAILQSPWFLYRVELGEADPDDPTRRRYTSEEMATRLAYFLWNTTPDTTLLDAGAAGELVTDEGLAAQVERMLADERAKEGVRALFDDVFTLYELDDLAQDPTLFTHMSPDVGPAAREETLRVIERIVFQDEDWRSFYTTRDTYLDPVLAALYNVRAPTREGFGAVTLDPAGGRAGFFGQASFLALQSHPTATSPTLRGMFVRTVVLCQDIPPPPADVDASIPEADTTSPTMRDRLTVHMSDPTCASCHQLTDPIGLGFENFDALGVWRVAENGATIDPGGVLDGGAFVDAVSLGQVVSQHPQIAPCLARTVFRYANGRAVGDGESDLVSWHADGLEESSFRVKALLADIATSPGFRRVGDLE